ncbi:hypothetical protein LZG37_12860 [Halomonas titanicae]|uniref:hypothetical protein n=1 Tax=Vreelandella titanicae TaxID=664683 RepID=UPI001F31FC4B|nr:hypothetical protein [Halomonas titanicae]MCE7519032.1 hypothetical protein [Halomonas titanicae]
MLAFRPEVEVAGSIPFPKSILSGTNYNSVGSYGVFYEGEGHLIDFIYSIAKWLSPQSYVNSCNLILNTFKNEMSFAGRETICTVGIEKFLKHLLGMKIGAPVSTPEIGGFLNSLIRKAAEEAGEEPPVVDIPVFNEYISDENRSIGGGFRLLLINVGDNA